MYVMYFVLVLLKYDDSIVGPTLSETISNAFFIIMNVFHLFSYLNKKFGLITGRLSFVLLFIEAVVVFN